MSEQPLHDARGQVVVGVDDCAEAAEAAAWAADEASRRRTGLMLVSAYSVPHRGLLAYDVMSEDYAGVLRTQQHVFMANGKEFCIILSAFFPDQLSHEIRLAKDLVHHLSERGLFVVIDADEDDPIILQQPLRDRQTRIDHRHPVRMISTARI